MSLLTRYQAQRETIRPRPTLLIKLCSISLGASIPPQPRIHPNTDRVQVQCGDEFCFQLKKFSWQMTTDKSLSRGGQDVRPFIDL
jgi:hypothetical protein